MNIFSFFSGAGHIIPWANSSSQQKLNPENGICLSALYDKAFDKGLITISPDDYTICLSEALHEYETEDSIAISEA